MTTIAYKDGKIAYDSRMLRGGKIIDDDHDKHTVATFQGRTAHFFGSGSVADINKLIEAYVVKDCSEDLNASCLVVEDGEIYEIGSGDGYWEVFVTEPCTSIGSGSDHAFTAMDLGLSAENAVHMSIKRDASSGGTVRVFDIESMQEVTQIPKEPDSGDGSEEHY